jgi:hypothetical protein
MRRFLLASVATAGLALTLPAFAQTTVPVPATPPPVTTPAPDADATLEGQVETQLQTPSTQTETAAEAATQVSPDSAATQAQVTGEGRTELAVPRTEPAAPTTAEVQTPSAPTVGVTAPNTAQAEVAPPSATASVDTQGAMQATTPMPNATASVDTQAATPAVGAEAQPGALAVPASASEVCAERTTSVHFGARGSALSRPNQNAIEQATDAASVCSLQSVTIVDSAEGRTHSRRAEAVRATLLRQGVPAERITIAQEVNADAEAASTGRLDVRMAFAGVANQAALEPQATAGANAAADASVETALATEMVPVPAPQAAPPAATRTEPEPAPGT